MAYDYTVITYGGGHILTEVFNGIAAAVGTQSYTTIVGIASLFGLCWVMIETTFKQSLQISIRWFVVFFVMYNLLLVPKVTVHIDDKVTQTQVNIVQNVPWGLAEFASVITQLFNSMTKLAETVYTLPDDLKYSHTGALMASSLIRSANRFVITDPQFANNVDHFMQQCVFYDLLLGKYTTKDLFNATDLWGFMTANASPARAFRYDRRIVTCQQGARQLTQDWQKELHRAGIIYGSRFFNQQTAAADQQLLTYLPIAYRYLSDVSQSAQQIMQQNMVKNAIEHAVIDHAGHVNANAALRAYAYARAQQTKRRLYDVAGQQASYWLPIMKVVFEAILFGAFLLLAPLWLLPFGLQLFRIYLFALVWIESWAPLYAILNLVMTLSAKVASQTATAEGSSHGLTMMTMPGLVQANHDISVLAGYLSLSIPVIAYAVTKGGVMSFMTLAQYIGGATQSAASQAVQEETTGNLSFGNTTIGNHSAFNTNANHVDTNARVFSGAYSTQMAGGSALTITPNGKAVLDNRGAISSLGTSVNIANALRSVYTHQADKAWSNTLNDARTYAHSMSAALRGLYDLGATQSHTQASNQASSVSQQGSLQTAANELHQLTNTFAQSHGITHQQAGRALISTYLNGHLGLKGSRSLAGKVLQFFTGIDGAAGFDVKAGLEGSLQRSHQQLWNEAKQFIHNSSFNQTVDQAIKASHDHSVRTGNETSQRFAHTISSAFDRAEQARHDLAAQFQQTESFRQMASYSQDNAVSINANASQAFVDWMKAQPAPGSHEPMGMRSVEYIMANRPALAQEYASHWSQQQANHLMQQFMHQSGHASASSIRAGHVAQTHSIPGESAMDQFAQRNDQQVVHNAAQHELGQEKSIDRTAQRDTQTLFDAVSHTLTEKMGSVDQRTQTLKHDNVNKLD